MQQGWALTVYDVGHYVTALTASAFPGELKVLLQLQLLKVLQQQEAS